MALTIGRLADRLGVPVRTVRFWSDEGLVDPPPRTAGGYRLYDDAPGAGIAAGMRTLPAELPEEPTPEQVGAWLELARLVADPAFAERVREMALAGAGATPEEPDTLGADAGRMMSIGRRGLDAGLAPGSPGAEALVGEWLGEVTPARRAELADRLATFTDARVERYWQLLGVLNGWPPFQPSVPAVEWWIATLRARS